MRSLPKAGGAQDGPQLGVHDVGTIEEDPHGTPAQEGVHLLREIHVGQFFVAADVHGADDYRLVRHGLCHFFVGLELLVFGRQRVTVHEEELGTVQTHALGAVADGTLGILDGP